jgi:hypothetical protein
LFNLKFGHLGGLGGAGAFACQLQEYKRRIFNLHAQRAEIVSHLVLAKVCRSALRRRLVEIVLDGSIRAAFDQELDSGHVPALGCHVKRRDSLAMRSSAKRGLPIDVRAVIQQPSDCFRTIAHRSPD